MKIYNKNLEEIKNPEREKEMKALIERNIKFLVEQYGIDEQFLRERANKLSVVEKEGDTHYVVYNGEKQEIGDQGAASFVTKKEQKYDGEKWEFEVAVYTSDNNGDHTKTHELFHYLSENAEVDFNSDDIGYDKSGIHITGYDREDNVVDKKLDANGLNEGMTELLATQLDKEQTPAAYDYQSYIAGILVGGKDKSLIDAYFSEDIKEFQEFLEQFDTRQSEISSKELISLSEQGNEVNTRLLKGCLDYTLSFCNNIEELKEVRRNLLPIFKSMNKNLNIGYDNEDFELKKFFKDTFSEKRKKMEINPQEIKNGIKDLQINKVDEAAKYINGAIKEVEGEEVERKER